MTHTLRSIKKKRKKKKKKKEKKKAGRRKYTERIERYTDCAVTEGGTLQAWLSVSPWGKDVVNLCSESEKGVGDDSSTGNW